MTHPEYPVEKKSTESPVSQSTKSPREISGVEKKKQRPVSRYINNITLSSPVENHSYTKPVYQTVNRSLEQQLDTNSRIHELSNRLELSSNTTELSRKPLIRTVQNCHRTVNEMSTSCPRRHCKVLCGVFNINIRA